MPRARRVVAVTALLVVLGAVAGALAGALVATSVIATSGLPRNWRDLSAFGAVAAAGAVFGAPLGAVLLPVAGWLLMRRVRLGRALLGTMLGTVAGGLVGWFARGGGETALWRILATGVAGFSVAVLLLRRSATARDAGATTTTTSSDAMAA